MLKSLESERSNSTYNEKMNILSTASVTTKKGRVSPSLKEEDKYLDLFDWYETKELQNRTEEDFKMESETDLEYEKDINEVLALW